MIALYKEDILHLQSLQKLHNFATTNTNFPTIDYFRHALLYNVHVYQFSAKLGVEISPNCAHK